MSARRILASVAAVVAVAAPAPAQQRPDVAPPVTLPQTHEHVVHSAIVGRDYYVSVALPMTYRETDTTRYPILYVLDGGAHLPLMASMFRLTNRSGRTGDVIMVGVGYYPAGAFTATPAGQTPLRNIDYTTPHHPVAGADSVPPPAWTPGAPQFLRALREEIIPFVERRYRASADRALHGHSYGGLFATYVLFEDPDLFTRYAIMSPAYGWDGEASFARELRFRRGRTSLPKQIFLGVGGLEGPAMIGYMWRMTAALCAGLRTGRYAGLTLNAEVVPGEHHGSAVLFGRPLRDFYPPYAPVTPRDDVCRAL